MRNTQSEPYWPEVQRERARLEAVYPNPNTPIFITNTGGPGKGRVCAALRETVARTLVDGTHRLSTPEEIENYKAEQALIAEAMNKEALARVPKYQMILPPEFERSSRRGKAVERTEE